MKKLLSLAAIILMAYSSADAQILWKISGNGLKEPSYILGTHHMAPLSILDEIKGFPAAFSAVDGVCGELVMSEMNGPETLLLMQQAMMLPNGQKLPDLYTEEEYVRINDCFKKFTGMDLKMMESIKPAAVMQQIVLFMYMKHLEGYNPNEQLDTYLQTKAEKAGKQITSLETVKQQIDILFNSPLEEQAEDLLYLVDNEEESMEDAEELTEAYMDQDLKEVLKAMQEEKDGEDMEKLLYERNADWLTKMPEMMAEGPVMFVVGAGHLPGERGVLQGLKAKGYRLKAVR